MPPANCSTIDAEVDWNIELGTIARLAQGAGTGPALLFNNIRDYGENARCRQVFTGGLVQRAPRRHDAGAAARHASARTGQDSAAPFSPSSIAPKIVKTGPVKENIVKGDDIDLYEFPVPQWNRHRRRPLHSSLMAAWSPRIPTPA